MDITQTILTFYKRNMERGQNLRMEIKQTHSEVHETIPNSKKTESGVRTLAFSTYELSSANKSR
jgi:hypothetical protein